MQQQTAGEIRRKYAAKEIMGAYMRIGTVITEELDDMTIGERERLLTDLERMEQMMACVGLKRLFR